MWLLQSPVFLALLLFAGMLVCSEAGRRLAEARARRGMAAPDGFSVVDTAVLGLLGLIVAFSFSGASDRFDARRQLVVEETNAIGAAYLQLDLLPAEARPVLQDLFRKYTDSRIELYRRFPDIAPVREALYESKRLQNEIWTRTVAAAEPSEAAATILVPALNEMFNVTTTRATGMLMHPPPVIFAMLFCLALASGVVAGYGIARPDPRDWIRPITFAAITALTFYVIVDLEFPRLGAIQIDAMDHTLTNLRASMN